jgi:molecular chaperone DnaK
MHERQWVAAKLKAEELLGSLSAALPLGGDALDAGTRETIGHAAKAVRDALAAEDLEKLKSANQQLDAATESLAAVIVERAMEESLQRRM